MSRVKLPITLVTIILMSSLAACFGDGEIRLTCDEPQLYQAAVETKKVVAPDGLDGLEEYREMPTPKAESQARPAGSRCIESPPPVSTK